MPRLAMGRISKTIAGCDRRAAGGSRRTSDARSSRRSTTLVPALRACAALRLASLGLARRWSSRCALGRSLLVLLIVGFARAASAQPAGNLTLDPFRPAIDSRGYLTVNASQVLGDRELSFGLGSLDWGYKMLNLSSGGNTYDVNNIITATLIAACGIKAGPAELEFGASAPFVVVGGDRGPDFT